MRIAVRSVNVGLPRAIGMQSGEAVISGIRKTPVIPGSLRVGPTGIEGDGQADLRVHGGPDKAVYAYPSDHWSWWQKEHGLTCQPATFGENLTLEGADEEAVAIGDRFQWGDVLLEVSQPRAPCYKLAMHLSREDLPALMTLSARCGFYLRVIATGAAPGQNGWLERVTNSHGPSVRESFVAALHRTAAAGLRKRILEAPALAAAWRAAVARQIR